MTAGNPMGQMSIKGRRLTPIAPPLGWTSVGRTFIDTIYDADHEAADLRRDWEISPPAGYRMLGLSRRKLKKLQTLSMLLRNRRIVCGYQLLDDRLRRRFAQNDLRAVPPTWLTVGKWVAKGIGDLLDDTIPIPHSEERLRRLVRFLLVNLFRSRRMPMGRILVMGNRVIFAQIGRLISELLDLPFGEDYSLDYPEFVLKYGGRLQRSYEEAVRPSARDPLSDSMLRAAHAYYRAMDRSCGQERDSWILVGNLHLGAYEQHIAELFLEKSLSFSPASALRQLFKNPRSSTLFQEEVASIWTLDMGLEGGILTRILNAVAAAFATRYILSFRIGVSGKRARRSVASEVLAPPYEFSKIDLHYAVDKSVYSLLDSPLESAQSLLSVWSALDYAHGKEDRTLVHDWRQFPYRISYIANLFVISQFEPYRSRFLEPVLSQADVQVILQGHLPGKSKIRPPGVRLTRQQMRYWKAASDLFRPEERSGD
jgi:hypothetical protein